MSKRCWHPSKQHISFGFRGLLGLMMALCASLILLARKSSKNMPAMAPDVDLRGLAPANWMEVLLSSLQATTALGVVRPFRVLAVGRLELLLLPHMTPVAYTPSSGACGQPGCWKYPNIPVLTPLV